MNFQTALNLTDRTQVHLPAPNFEPIQTPPKNLNFEHFKLELGPNSKVSTQYN